MSDDPKQDKNDQPRPPDYPLYELIAAPFERTHFRDGGGGTRLEYIDGEQCISRLNDTLGFLNWSFRIVENGIHAEADEAWVHGELTVTIGDRTVIKQQFGSQKLKRSRSSGTPLDIGFDLKGAATDALKKCATLVGVALYLYEKESPGDRVTTPGNEQGSGNKPTPLSAVGKGQPMPESYDCEECGETLTETRFKDGTNWSPDQLAVFGRRKHSRTLCMTHYRAANQSKRAAEEGAAF